MNLSEYQAKKGWSWTRSTDFSAGLKRNWGFEEIWGKGSRSTASDEIAPEDMVVLDDRADNVIVDDKQEGEKHSLAQDGDISEDVKKRIQLSLLRHLESTE